VTFNPFYSFKSADTFDFINLSELLDKNKEMIHSFFGKNPFDENFIRNILENGNLLGQDAIADKDGNRSIPMDLIQRKNEILVIFEIPGLKSEEDVEIKVLGSTLIVEGEIKRDYYLSDKEKVKFERKIGPFSKKVVLPVVFDQKKIHAKYMNGLLEVRIPIVKSNRYEKVLVRF